MDLQYLINVAKSMAKDSYIYREAGEQDTADAFCFEEGELKFLVSFENEWWAISCVEGIVSFTKKADIGLVLSANAFIPLKKHAMLSYPDLDYLFYYGDKNITDWLDSLRWNKYWGFNGNFKDPVGQQYVNWSIGQNPFYSGDRLFALETGWSLIWPDDDEPLQTDPNNEFLFCTLYHAEPWYEVYRQKDTGMFTCYVRTT